MRRTVAWCLLVLIVVSAIITDAIMTWEFIDQRSCLDNALCASARDVYRVGGPVEWVSTAITTWFVVPGFLVGLYCHWRKRRAQLGQLELTR
jgi:hypothetical protein